MRLYFTRSEQMVVVILLAGLLVGLGAMASGMAWRQREVAGETPLLAQVVPPPAPVDTPLVVHVTGAVRAPGVYQLPAGTRVAGALAQAGGVRADGYPDPLNLAAPVLDGDRVYVPTREEWAHRATKPLPALVTSAPDGEQPRPVKPRRPGHRAPRRTHTRTTTAAPAPATPTSLHLNTATLAQLQTLPGIGPHTAQAIIDYRTKHGRFEDLSQLLAVPGIGPSTYDTILPYVRL